MLNKSQYQHLESFQIWAKLDPHRADNYQSVTQERVVKVWDFRDAPIEYQRLSENGGDEDWVALIPIEYGSIPYFIEQMSSGLFSVDQYAVDVGIIYIGAHA
jgi:hypothetical protein